MRTLMRPLSRMRGLSLVELMIGLVLGLLLLGGVLQVFIGSRQAYRTNDALSRTQESGRFAIQFLTQDLRLAAYQGCSNLESVEPKMIANPPSPFDAGNVLQGVNDVPAGTSVGGRAVVTGTDTLTMRFADPNGARLTGAMASTADTITVTRNRGNWKANDALFITDCESADVFRASNDVSDAPPVIIEHAAGANTSGSLSKPYGIDAQVMTFRTHTYYVSDTGRTGGNGVPILSLYRDADELVEGILSMQVVYGVDTNGDRAADDYVTADAVGDWSEVIAARVCVVTESSDANVATAAVTVPCNGVDVVIPNNRLGQAFTTTVGLRNRLP